MKCPKCHYLSFEPEPRCKNCGYDLLETPRELSIKAIDEPEGPLADFDLHPARPASTQAGLATALVEDDPRLSSAREPWPSPTTELPLFIKAMPKTDVAADEPMVKVPAAPRQPLGVRRQTPDPSRMRAHYHREAVQARTNALPSRGLLDLDLQDEPSTTAAPIASDAQLSVPSTPTAASVATPDWALAPINWIEPAGAFRRLEAATIDLLFMGAINLALVWLTLQQCDLTLTQVASLPLLPLSAFLLLLNGGYLLMFTATNGQTVGKMAAHIRVVGSADEATRDARPSLRQAALRALLTIPSVLVFGVGFLPGLLGEKRAVHDRLAHTRVVRA